MPLLCTPLPAPISKYQPTRGQQQAANSSSSQQPAAKYMCMCSQQQLTASNQQPAAASSSKQQANTNQQLAATSSQLAASYMCAYMHVCAQAYAYAHTSRQMSKTNLNNEMIHLFAKSTNVHKTRAPIVNYTTEPFVADM